MPKNKDLKRLVRTRMQKTGESYTAARAQVTRKNKTLARSGLSEERYAELAGMRDEAVHAKTGRTWKQWVRVLDAIDAGKMTHRAIALHLKEAHGLPPWWSQTVTVGYERIRGLRDVGQRRGGAYEVNKSRTFTAPVSTLYCAFSSARIRTRWLSGVELTVRKSAPDRSLRITWPDGTRVEVNFTAKGEAKSQAAIEHKMLASKADAEKMKGFWSERLDALSAWLARDAGRG
jgi:uncharacterized protein YndB with AHSA1/START domain